MTAVTSAAPSPTELIHESYVVRGAAWSYNQLTRSITVTNPTKWCQRIQQELDERLPTRIIVVKLKAPYRLAS